jgi:hypothetical protein
MKTQVKLFATKLMILTALVLLIGKIYGQEPERPRPPMIPDSTQIVKMVDELTAELQLSNDQKVKISNLYFAHFKEMKAKQEANIRKHEKEKEEMQQNRQKFENKVKSELTNEQQAKFEKFVQTKKQNRDNRPKPQGQQ